MTRDQIQAQSLDKIKRMSVWMIIGYAIIVIAAVLGITVFAVHKYDNVMKDKVSSLTSSLNVQMKLNLDSYLSRMETVGTLAFSVDNAYTYDASDASNDEYEALNIEKQISDDLKSLCLMENFVDYGIVYRNNHTVGKISNGTTQLFGNSLFEEMEAIMTRDRTHDGWKTGCRGDYERVYYVKRIHDNAVFVISFYTAELSKVFENPETLSDMTVRLTDTSYNIIYSSAKDEPGSMMPSDILKPIQGKDTATITDDDNMTTVNISNGDWYVICSIPTKVILKEADDIRKIIYVMAVLAALIAVAAGAFFVRRMADPVGTVTGSLSDEISEDGFNNVLGSRFFRDKADNLISKSSDKQLFALTVIDIDNFMEIVNTFGRDFADAQLTRMTMLIHEVYGEPECIGRLAEDTFAVLTKSSDGDAEKFKGEVVQNGVDICDKYSTTEHTPTMGNFMLSASVGASICPLSGKTYQEICDSANNALRASKNEGKSRFTLR